VIFLWWEILKNVKVSGKGKGTTLSSSRINIQRPEDCNKKLQQWAKNVKKIKPILQNLHSNNKWFRKNFRENHLSIFTSSFLFKKYEADTISSEADVFSIEESIDDLYNTIPEKVACKIISQFNSTNIFEQSEFMGYTIKTWRGRLKPNIKQDYIEVWEGKVDRSKVLINMGYFLQMDPLGLPKYYPDANKMNIIEDLIEWDKELPKWWV